MSSKLTSFILPSFTLTLVAVASVGCSLPSRKKTDDSKAGTTTVTSAEMPKAGAVCHHEKAGTCTELGKDDPLGLLEVGCKDIAKATYKKSASCPTDNLLGTCERKGEKEFYYFGGKSPWVEDAKASCEKDGLEPGKFTASPNAEQTAKDKAIPTADHISASCTDSMGTCEDLYGDLLELQTSSCEQSGGKLATTPCPSDKLVGSCVKSGRTERHYEKEISKYKKLADLQKDCESYAIPFGHWYPNPDYKEAAAPKKAKKKKAKKPADE